MPNIQLDSDHVVEFTDKELPKWLTRTPKPVDDYQLLFRQDNLAAQLISLTRAEFLFLKSCLAERRGYLTQLESKYLEIEREHGFLLEAD